MSAVGSFKNDMWHSLRRSSFRLFRPGKFARLQSKRLPFDTHRCIFIHIPKCAGISVGRSLFGENFEAGHPSLKRYQIIFGPKEFNRYFKFTFVRNPFDRLVSAFFFLKKGGMNPKDKKWAEENLAAHESFDAFVKNWVTPENIRSARHFSPQSDYICLGKKRPSVDFIGYYENLEADFQIISRKLNLNSTLAEMNRTPSRSKDYREYYTDETRAIVAKVYADDIQLLGYTFDNANLPDLLAQRDGKAA